MTAPQTHPGPSHPGPTAPSQPPAPGRDHSPQSGWAGPAGECGVSCACGTTFDGFDTIAEAAALLDEHIADSQPAPSRGHLPIGAEPANLPRLGEIIRDAERLAVQLLAVLGREYDPASAPADLAWPGVTEMRIVDLHLAFAVARVQSAMTGLARAAALSMPAVGSAVPVAQRDPGSGALICVGKSKSDAVKAVCGRTDQHALHRVGQPDGDDSRACSGGPGPTGSPR